MMLRTSGAGGNGRRLTPPWSILWVDQGYKGTGKAWIEEHLGWSVEVVERTSSWQAKLAHKKLLWCTERVGKVIDFWVAFFEVVIIVRRLAREGWVRYRWEGRPVRRP